MKNTPSKTHRQSGDLPQICLSAPPSACLQHGIKSVPQATQSITVLDGMSWGGAGTKPSPPLCDIPSAWGG